MKANTFAKNFGLRKTKCRSCHGSGKQEVRTWTGWTMGQCWDCEGSGIKWKARKKNA